MKERSERRWRGGAVRAVKSQGGGVVARWRSVHVSGRRCWRASVGEAHVAWCGLARRLASDEGLQNQPMAGLLQGLLQCCPGKLARWVDGGENGPTMHTHEPAIQVDRWRGRHANSCGGEDNQGTWLRGHAHHS